MLQSADISNFQFPYQPRRFGVWLQTVGDIDAAHGRDPNHRYHTGNRNRQYRHRHSL